MRRRPTPPVGNPAVLSGGSSARVSSALPYLSLEAYGARDVCDDPIRAAGSYQLSGNDEFADEMTVCQSPTTCDRCFAGEGRGLSFSRVHPPSLRRGRVGGRGYGTTGTLDVLAA